MASKLGVSRMDLEDFIKGSTSAAMAKRLGLTIEASDELAGLGGGSGATGILLGLLLP